MLPIYLDHNATTPVLPDVVDAMLPYLREHFGNPSSGHVYGVRTREAVTRAREQVAHLLCAQADEIVFVSCGTEANTLAIRGVWDRASSRDEIVTTVTEHPATMRTCNALSAHGKTVHALPVDHEGLVSLSHAETLLSERTALVTILHAHNETGVLQPIREISRIAHRVGAVMHTDAAQSVGKVRVDVNELEVDLLSVVGHKLYAPKGVGALYVRRGTQLQPTLLGGGHEHGMRSGTENVASIVGLGAACEIASRELERESQRVLQLRETLWNRLRESVPGVALNGHVEHRLPNTLNVRFPRVTGTALLRATPEIAASTGSACHDGHEQASAVLLHMGIAAHEAMGSVRLTLGRLNQHDDVVRAAEALISAWKRLAFNS